MKTILVVDDDQDARTVLQDLLTGEGYKVVQAADGIMALAVVEKVKVDLIITDRSMPEMDGLEMLRRLQEKKSTIPALMISAFGENELWGQAIGYGATDYLLKPFVPEDVLKIIKKVLSGKKK